MTQTTIRMAERSQFANAGHYLLDRHVEEERGDRIAVRCAGERLSYAEIFRRANQAARLFCVAGVRPGDRVLLVLPDGPAFVVAFFALVRMGAVPVPLSTMLSSGDFSFVAGDCASKVAVITSTLLPAFKEILAQRTSLGRVWLSDADDASAEFPSFESALAKQDDSFPVQPVESEDIALIQYTSGSTGRPKGVVHRHGALRGICDGFPARLALGPADICYSAAKMSFGYGLGNSLLFPFSAGATSILRVGACGPYEAYETIQMSRPTLFFGVPSLYAAMLKVTSPEREFDLSSIRVFISAGEHLTESVFTKWKQRFGREIINGIGCTECLHIFISGEAGRTKAGSAGSLIHGWEAKILDDEHGPVPIGEVGHLYVNGPGNSHEYWNHADNNKAMALKSWIRTGDLFHQDTEGFFFYAGRSDDQIKTKGFKIYPIEIEEVLSRHARVKECAVVGASTVEGVTEVRAYVVLQADQTGDKRLARELKLYLLQTLPPQKCPDRIEFVAELPKTATGKVARYKLRMASLQQPA